MSTTVSVERRNWLRLPVVIPAILQYPDESATIAANIVNISESGIGFTAEANLQPIGAARASFWLPFDPARANDASLQPVVVRLTLVSSRYNDVANVYEYSGVFIGLGAQNRSDIRRCIALLAGSR